MWVTRLQQVHQKMTGVEHRLSYLIARGRACPAAFAASHVLPLVMQ
jgi:hypothetical protein